MFTTFPHAGHVPNDPRDAFLGSIEASTPDLDLAGRLRNCTDTMPRSACEMLNVPLGSTFAQAARRIRRA